MLIKCDDYCARVVPIAKALVNMMAGLTLFGFIKARCIEAVREEIINKPSKHEYMHAWCRATEVFAAHAIGRQVCYDALRDGTLPINAGHEVKNDKGRHVLCIDVALKLFVPMHCDYDPFELLA
jgi:hypothetical protein